MNVLKAVLEHEVFPALGCTEPIAVAYAASLAAEQTGGDIASIAIMVDPGVFKNGFAVTIPNTGGEKGNLIAGVLGALIRRPDLKMEILTAVDARTLDRARRIVASKTAGIGYDGTRKTLFIDVTVTTATDTARAVIREAHTNLVLLEKNGHIVHRSDSRPGGMAGRHYRQVLKHMTFADFVALADAIDDADAAAIQRGIEMNLAVSEAGRKLEKVGYYVSNLRDKGFLENDIFAASKILTASAVDARMAGLSYPVMSSGGSGNQGVVAILVPYNVGRHFNVPDDRIVQSIALSHLVNSYIKCFTGELSPLCGCAIASGVGAAVAIVYQQHGGDMEKITLAVNTVISDLGGMLCDGAKGGCALKVASSTDSAIRAAYMALHGHGITHREGFVGKSAEETIRHLGRIGTLGMEKTDHTMLEIMIDKSL